ncbi:MAG: DNA polymerase IV [Chloroflexi bacterium]|nr:DNA polymerase IV [Chloroflexota bacterium]
MERKIIHLDLDAFFCSVEELLDPTLKGKAFAVGGSPSGRGVITSASYAARLHGVRSAMPTREALHLLPDLILVRSGFRHYSEYSKKVMDILRDTSPIVEAVSIDEAFLDVSDMPQPIGSIALDLQKRVMDETGLPCSLGCATSRLVAKMANDFGKKQVKSGRSPQKITVVEPGKEEEFLAPLDIQALWGVGPKTAAHLRQRGITTIGRLAALSDADIRIFFGKHGESMRRRARGIDHTPIYPESSDPKSVSNEITFHEDQDDEGNLLKILRGLSEKVGSRLRKAELAGSVVQIKIRYSDFSTYTRQTSIKECTNLDQNIYEEAQNLFLKHWSRGRAVRLLGVGVTNLDKPHRQLGLFDNDGAKKEDLTKAVDDLRDRFGKDIIKRADTLKGKNR